MRMKDSLEHPNRRVGPEIRHFLEMGGVPAELRPRTPQSFQLLLHSLDRVSILSLRSPCQERFKICPCLRDIALALVEHSQIEVSLHQLGIQFYRTFKMPDCSREV